MTSFVEAAFARAQQHDQPDRPDREGLCQAYDAAQGSGPEVAPLPEPVSAIPDGRGVVLTPTAEVRLTQLSNATVAYPDGEAWVKSDCVRQLEEVR